MKRTAVAGRESALQVAVDIREGRPAAASDSQPSAAARQQVVRKATLGEASPVVVASLVAAGNHEAVAVAGVPVREPAQRREREFAEAWQEWISVFAAQLPDHY